MIASIVIFWMGCAALMGHLFVGNYWAGKR